MHLPYGGKKRCAPGSEKWLPFGSLHPSPITKYWSNLTELNRFKLLPNVSRWIPTERFWRLILNALTSVRMFSMLFPMVLTWRIWLQLRSSSFSCGHFYYSHDLNIWFTRDTVRKNKLLATLSGLQKARV